MTRPEPRTGTDPAVFGYYGVAGDGGKIRLLWAEREKTAAGSRPAGQWWLPVYYPNMAEAEADLSVRNDTAHYPARITPPGSVGDFAGVRP